MYSHLKDRIVFSELKPGEALNETKLAAEFGVSRTLLREVIHRLVAEGLLVASPGQGAHVDGIDLIQFKNTFEMRAPLEELAGRLAAVRSRAEDVDALRQVIREGESASERPDYRELARLDWRFHAIIGDATRNPKLANLLLQLLVPFNRLWYIAMSDFGNIGDAVGDWRRAVDGLERRAPEDLAKILLAHMGMATVLVPVLSVGFEPAP